MCLYPKLVKNRKYTSNKKNGGIIPPLPLIEFNGKMINDERVTLVPVGCGKCMECMKKKSREWQVRLLEEIRHNNTGHFITFTFSNEEYRKLAKGIKLEGYELDNEIAKIATRKFLERWRRKYKKSVKHWLVTELGQNGTENIHLHGILWTDKTKEEINERWGYGYTWIGDYLSEATVNYITKYVTKTDIKHKEYKPIILTSAGIGKNYTNRYDAKNNKYKKNDTNEAYTNRQGFKLSLPIYYRNKLYTEEEREKLWIEKLNEKTRYVNGIKIDVSKNEDMYYRILEKARELNKRLGYGDDKINWERKTYELERRLINQEKRKGDGGDTSAER